VRRCGHRGAAAWPEVRLGGWEVDGLHALRVVDAVVIDLPLPSVPGDVRWVASIWSDPDPAVGWLRDLWVPVGEPRAGWRLSDRLAFGDVVEFGGDVGPEARRWYGVVTSYDGAWLVLEGPRSDPTSAERLAERRLDERRHRPRRGTG